MPNRDLALHSRFFGHISVTSDPDGVYRKVPLFYRYKDGYMPSFPLALAAAELKIDPSRVVVDAGKEVVLLRGNGTAIHIPMDLDGSAWIPYPSYWGKGWKRIPLDKLCDAALNEDSESQLIEELGGRIVVVADTTTAKKDFGVTPFETLYPLSGIHTSILNGILTDGLFRSEPLGLAIFVMVLALCGCLIAASSKRALQFHAFFGAVFVALCAITLALWLGLRIVPWFAAPAAAIVISWLIVFGIRLLAAREERLLLESALSRYFPRSLATRVLAERKTDLLPASKELTILFADVSGFTKWSSDKDPETVHAFLSDYLETMAGVIFEHGGTVDKFIGDGLLAFFGDPFDQPDHAERCLRAALAMQAKVIELRSKWLPSAGMDLRIRIGINSGRVIVGNLGSKTRIEYTVIGSAVNLASRMESNAPVGGILVASSARRFVGPKFAFSEEREVAAKGYEEPIEAFVLEGEHS